MKNMYAGAGFSDWEIGDVDVLIVDGVYHLFHLIIPNHDYIAHATSRDGITWRRVKNALFVGDPGAWDDDMLWTMHVSRKDDKFQMYYTGLQRSERGTNQQIGLAISDDLLHWHKVQADHLPISPLPPHYETKLDSPREWTSFRDPFRYEYDGEEYLLVCARSSSGPASRRGCVGLLKIKDDVVEHLKPLMYPGVYDDVECPCIFQIKGTFYLLGSIREDINVRYWFADDFRDIYRSFHADVLLPKGNYAARVVKDGDHWLIYNFYFSDGQVNSLRVLPPPKELDTDDRGRLILRTYYRWDQMALLEIKQDNFPIVQQLLNNETASKVIEPHQWTFSALSGYEVFFFQKPSSSLIWEGTIRMEGLGKFGLVLDIDSEGNGYFLPFDLVNGFVQIRRWGFNPDNKRENFIFKNIQANLFKVSENMTFHFRLIRYGNYLELAINGLVKLTLMDHTFEGANVGLYSASSIISLLDSSIKTLPEPQSEYVSPVETQS